MIYLTEKQHRLLSEMLPVMQAFYNADFAPMCDMLGAENNVPKEEIEAAKEVLSAFSRRLLAPVSAMVDFCREFADKVEKAAQINQKTPTDLCPGALRRSIDCTKQEVYRLNCVLDTYTRLFLGQFFVIFEQLLKLY